MPLEGGEFYDRSPPAFLQQGDILRNVPLISLPPSKELVVLRTSRSHAPLTLPLAGDLEVMREGAVNAFAGGAAESVVVSAIRGMAVLITQTCDLADSENWLVCVVRTVQGSEVDRGNLFADKYSDLFGLPQHPNAYFGESYIDLTDIRPIRRETVELAERIVSLTRAAQNALTEKLALAFSRRWGFAPGDEVLVGGKYRCNRCNNYHGVENPDQEFKVGERFPECQNCKKIRKTAAWYLLVEHKKS